MRVAEVAEREDGTILHILQDTTPVPKGIRVRGLIDPERRRDHMQQHSGQHILSAAFVRLFDMPTVSFHMGADYCSIDLDAKSLNLKQVEAAEALANEVVQENRPVEIRFVTQEEARGLGLRKLPPVQKDELRLIDIRDFDLTACGGTHVQGTAQIGCILLRKTEKVRQGWRVEFVCGKRAVSTARRDYTTLSDAAGVLSTQLWDVPQQIQKLQEESRASRKSREQLHEELAGLYAERMLSETQEIGGRKIITRTFPDRDLSFIKLLAQKLTRQSSSASRAPGRDFSPAGVGFRSILWPTIRYGSLDERSAGQARRTRRRKQRHGTGRTIAGGSDRDHAARTGRSPAHFVILSATSASLREADAESKDPYHRIQHRS